MDEVRAALAGGQIRGGQTRQHKPARRSIHYSRIYTALPVGMSARVHLVEVSIHAGLPAFEMSGLAQGQVRQLRSRIGAAIKNSGYGFPDQRIVCAVTPEAAGTGTECLDLPVALAVLEASGQLKIPDSIAALGMLNLLGGLETAVPVFNPLRALRAKEIPRVLLPYASAIEASLRPEGVVLVRDLDDAAKRIRRARDYTALEPTPESAWPAIGDRPVEDEPELVDLPGQRLARHALQLAASGGHHLLMLGGPGCGKTSLARLAHALLPDMDAGAREETLSLFAAAGRSEEHGGSWRPPWRAVSYQVTDAALLGGGSWPIPGEVSLASNGVLFLDELTEFRTAQLDSLRSCLSDGTIRLLRSRAEVVYPTRFLLVGACNPCPCGYLLEAGHSCSCTETQIRQKLGHLSGPFRDRIDLWVNLQRVPDDELGRTINQLHLLPLADLRAQVLEARERQAYRAGKAGLDAGTLNSRIPATRIEEIFEVNGDSAALAEDLARSSKLSVRGYQQLLRVSRTAADLQGNARVTPEAVALAFQFHENLPASGGAYM